MTTYYQHFGLSGPPFRFDASPGALFIGKAHREALAALEWGLIHEPSGFTLLIGKPGTGKSTLASVMMLRNYDRVRAAYVPNPHVGFDGALREILRQLGVMRPAAYRAAAVEALNTLLCTLSPGERVVMVFDEAQSLSDDDLEELRLLASCGRFDERQLCFVLIGTPPLLERLNRPLLRSLHDRIGARAILRPLDRAESFQYVAYRLHGLGGDTGRIFPHRTLSCLIEHSGGIPRRINVLCHNAMLIAFTAGVKRVGVAHAQAAIDEYSAPAARSGPLPEIPRVTPPQRHWFAKLRRPAAVFAVLWVAAMGAAYWWNSNDALSHWLAAQMTFAVERIDQLGGSAPQHQDSSRSETSDAPGSPAQPQE